MSRYIKIAFLALLASVMITAGTYAIVSREKVICQASAIGNIINGTSPVKEAGYAFSLPDKLAVKVSRGFPRPYYQSTPSVAEDGCDYSHVTYETTINYYQLGIDLLIWGLAAFLVLCLVARFGRKRV